MKSLYVILICLLAFGCAKQSTDPSQAFNAMAAAAESGDYNGFLSHLTRATRDYVHGVKALGGPNSGMLKTGPFKTTVKAMRHTIEADMAYVDVLTDSNPPEEGRVVLRFEEGAWKIDLLATEWVWSRNWALSGSANRPGYELLFPTDPTRSGNGQGSGEPIP